MFERGFPDPLFLCLVIIDKKCNSCYNVTLIFPGPEWPLSQGVWFYARINVQLRPALDEGGNNRPDREVGPEDAGPLQ